MLKFLAMLMLAYLVVASITFQLRHPWMTNTENLLNIKTALVFGKIEYKDTVRGQISEAVSPAKWEERKAKLKGWYEGLTQ